jgi:hypothetical protein
MLTIPNFGRNPEITVTFEHQGKVLKGIFSEVLGAAGYEWSFNVNGFFRGTMRWARISTKPFDPYDPFERDAKYGLKFYTLSGDLYCLEEIFIEQLVAGY